MVELPSLEIGDKRIIVRGAWHAESLRHRTTDLRATLRTARISDQWDLEKLTKLDRIGVALLTSAWGDELPSRLSCGKKHRVLLHSLAAPRIAAHAARQPLDRKRGWHDFSEFVGQLVITTTRLARGRLPFPWDDVAREIRRLVFGAFAIVTVISIVAGASAAYLFSLVLIQYGGMGYVVDILSFATVRDLAPLIAALLVGGRSGSAMAAELGTMRITQELDALQTMNIDVWSRVLLPKVLALVIGMPMLVLWAAVAILAAGIGICSIELPLTFPQMLGSVPDVLPFANVFIALLKALLFGLGIATIACYFGFSCKPNTQSLGENTTTSVVMCTAYVLVTSALIDIIFRSAGLA